MTDTRLSEGVSRIDLTDLNAASRWSWLDEYERRGWRVRQTETPGVYIVWRRS